MGTLKHDRMGIYARESDVMLADSETIDSAINACRAYGAKKGYTLHPDHIWKEARSGYQGAYIDQEALLDVLEVAKRGEIDVLVITEVRAISRRGAGEVFVIYDILQKANCRLETITETFENSAIGRYILSTRAFIAEVERENTYMRTRRGRLDRIKNGNLPGGGKPGYGLRWVDSEREPKAKKALDYTVVYTDPETEEVWTKVDVMRYFFHGVYSGISMHRLCQELTEKGIPSPGDGKYWRAQSLRRYLRNPEYMQVAIAHRKQVITTKAVRGKNQGKTISRLVDRQVEEQILLPEDTIEEAVVTKEVWHAVQEQLNINKEESLRNNTAEGKDLGIVRCGYAHCGICGHTMTVHRDDKRHKPKYYCHNKSGGEGLLHRHTTLINVAILDAQAWKKAVEVLLNPTLVRQKIAKEREKNKERYSREDIEATVAEIEQEIQNLFNLARGAKNNSTIDSLTGVLNELERKKQQAESMLYDADREAEERAELEAEILKFETWAEEVRPVLIDPTYTPTYEEMRLAVRIIGIHAIVFPEKGDFPCRVDIQATPPKIVEKLEKDKYFQAQLLVANDEKEHRQNATDNGELVLTEENQSETLLRHRFVDGAVQVRSCPALTRAAQRIEEVLANRCLNI